MSPSRQSTLNEQPKILVIRRDNIGDLVCTTPLLTALRQRFPNGWIGALVNSYNAPVLDGNPDIDEVFVYTKAKHRHASESMLGILWQRYQMMRRLRSMKLDDVIIATTSPQPRVVALAKWLKPKRIVGYGNAAGLDVSLPLDDGTRHEVEDVFRAASLYGIECQPPACRVFASGVSSPSTFTVGVHISARKPSQRWPAERFAETMRTLAAKGPVRFILLWSPGEEDNPLHPGDDAKAKQVLELVDVTGGNSGVSSVTVLARPTNTLPELISALAECHVLICADGGAMHLAAGLGLPIVCMFGSSGAQRWHPWGAPYRLLQPPSFDVVDITSSELTSAFNALQADIPRPTA